MTEYTLAGFSRPVYGGATAAHVSVSLLHYKSPASWAC